MLRFGVPVALASLLAVLLILTSPRAKHVYVDTAHDSNALASGPPSSSARHEYRHAVVRSGVYTAAEAQAAVARDEIVRAHYAGINTPKLQLVSSPGRQMYVSYRAKDRVYWTSKRVSVPAGEVILTDGTESIRARCGNRLSETPQMPTATSDPTSTDEEPSEQELDRTVPTERAEAVVPSPLQPPPGGYVNIAALEGLGLWRPGDLIGSAYPIGATGNQAWLPPGSTGTGFGRPSEPSQNLGAFKPPAGPIIGGSAAKPLPQILVAFLPTGSGPHPFPADGPVTPEISIPSRPTGPAGTGSDGRGDKPSNGTETGEGEEVPSQPTEQIPMPPPGVQQPPDERPRSTITYFEEPPTIHTPEPSSIVLVVAAIAIGAIHRRAFRK